MGLVELIYDEFDNYSEIFSEFDKAYKTYKKFTSDDFISNSLFKECNYGIKDNSAFKKMNKASGYNSFMTKYNAISTNFSKKFDDIFYDQLDSSIETYSKLNKIYNTLNKGGFKESDLKNFNIDIETYLPYDKLKFVIKEGYEACKKAHNLSKNNNLDSDYFKNDVRMMEDTLIQYLKGNVEKKDVLDKRIKYLKEAPEVNLHIYSSKSKSTLPQERGSHKRQKQNNISAEFKTNELAIDDIIPSYDFAYSQNIIDSANEMIHDYSVSDMMDKTREKIESDNGVVKITYNKSWSNLIDNLARKHNISSKSNFYKVNPSGSLRSIYVREGNQINVLEILSHSDYDTLTRSL